MTTHDLHLSTQITANLQGCRLDRALAHCFSDYSRSQWQKWIKNGSVSLNGQIETNVRQKVNENDTVDITADMVAHSQDEAQNIPLTIIFEDTHLLVIHKPIGLTVHPGAGQPDNTLVNALIHHDPTLAQLPRAGLIHRLDKNTSGLLVIAKTLPAYTALVAAMKERDIQRHYLALVKGVITLPGSIDAPIDRHPRWRTRMAVTPTGRPAITHYTIENRFPGHTLLRVTLETGRTHQIRVHLAHIKHPVVGDAVYGLRRHASLKHYSEQLAQALSSFPRQALHAYQLTLVHPITHETLTWTAPLPDDMQQLLQQLSNDTQQENPYDPI